MEIYQEILSRVLSQTEMEVTFPNLKMDVQAIVEMECYEALQRIQEILKDEELEDEECFMKIEEIVCLFEEKGWSCGFRHDF